MNTFANTVDIADPEHWELVGFYADDLSANGRASDAEALFRRQVELSEALVGKTRFPKARALSDLARFYYWHGRFSEAEPLFLESRDIYADVFGENSLYVAISDNELADLYQRLGMKSDAEDRYLKAILAY
jgi:tetratricopeptide (TPR) repeat protein